MNHSFMSFSCPELGLRQALNLARELGYEGFEPRTDSGHGHGIELNMPPEARREAAALVRDSGTALCCLATSVRLAGREKRQENLDMARRAAELCAALEIPSIRIFGGPIDENDTRDGAIAGMTEALSTLSRELGEEKICFCVETHDAWTEPVWMARVMENCAGPHVGVNWDLMHTRLASFRSEQEAAAVLAPYIRHVHIHDGTYRPQLTFLPMGSGRIDHRAALKELKKINYQGYLSGEWIGWAEPDYLRKEIAAIRAIEEELACIG